MISFTLKGHREKLAPPTGDEANSERLLYHQWRTREALHDHDVVINTYNTGTGKTRAALQRLIDLNGQGVNTLLIAPTNELITQHVRDVQKFIDSNDLDYRVLPARACDLHAMGSNLRRGETLYRLIRNYQEFDHLSTRRQAVVMVTNPDIFYYALYFRYQSYDQRNIFGEFVRRFDYIIVDEFHYYNNKQLANFLFAFALFDEFGYFSHPDHQRRICLLSATPRANVLGYLNKLFGKRLAEISPTTEPPESAAFETVPTLAPLEVHIMTGNLTEWLTSSIPEVVGWIEQDLDIAIISNSLARVNDAFRQLRDSLKLEHLGRITGPEPPEARADAVAARIILATPTVDIGYNFEKLDKLERQNIDVIVCEAQFLDDLIQRIGRAGRVLGKVRSDVPSRAVVLVSESAAQALRDLDGRILDRQAFADYLHKVEALPTKHRIEDYIRNYAIQELLFPLCKLADMMPEQNGQQELEALYKRLHDLLMPGSKNRRKSVEYGYRKLSHRERWLSEARANSTHPPVHTAEHLADWLAWLHGTGERPDDSAVASEVARLWREKSFRKDLIDFVQSQVTLSTALFQFRDSFTGPTAVFYDESGLFSSQRINKYDIFHLLSNYNVSAPMSRDVFMREFAANSEAIDEGAFYLRLESRREQPLIIEFVLYEDNLDEPEFNRRWTGIPVAIHGLEIQLRERTGDIRPVFSEVRTALKDQPTVCMIIPKEDEAVVRSHLFDSGYWWRSLEVYFPNTLRSQPYMLFSGLAAFEAHATLWRYFNAVKRRSEVFIF